MSEALRSVFAEFGFEIDFAALDKLEARLRETIKTEKDVAREADAAARAKAKADKEALDAQKKTFDGRVNAARDAAREERALAEAKAAFDATEEGKSLAALKASSAEIKSFGDVISRVSDSAMTKLGERLQASSKGVEGLSRYFGLSSKVVGQMFVGAVTAAAVVIAKITLSLVSFGHEFAAASEQLRDASANAGVTTSEFQSLAHAGVQSGVGADRLTNAVQSLHQQMQAGRISGGGINWTLRRMGVESRTAGRGIRSASDVMNDLASSFDRIQNPIRKDRIGVRLFGQDWYRLRDVMHGGEGGIASLRAEMEALGGGVLPEAVEASRQYTRATGRLGVAQDSLRSVLAVGILPAMTWVTNKAASLAGWWSRMTRGTHVVQVGLVALGAAAIVTGAALLWAFAPTLGPILLVGVGILAVWAALDDLVTLANGGNSVFGDLIDTLFGVGTATQMVQDLKDAWEGVVDAVSRAIEKVADFVGFNPNADDGRGAVRSTIRRPGSAPDARVGAPTGRGPVRSAIGPRTRPTTAFTAALAPIPGTTPAAAPYLAPIPITRPVAVGAPAAARTTVRQTTVANHNTFHLAGPDARQLAGQVGEILEQQARQQRDADHPQPGDDD